MLWQEEDPSVEERRPAAAGLMGMALAMGKGKTSQQTTI